MRLSLRWKWMGAHFVTGLIVLMFILFYLSSRLDNYFQVSFEERWQRELELVAQNVVLHHPQDLSITKADSLADALGATLKMRLTLIAADGRVIGDSRIDSHRLVEVENHIDRPEVVMALAHGVGKDRRLSATIDEELLYFAKRIKEKDELVGIIRIAVRLTEIQETRSEIQRLIWLATMIGLLFVLVIGFIVPKSITRRLENMISAAQKFAIGDFSPKLKTSKQDELSSLGDALDSMAGDLQSYITQITQEKEQLETILNSMVEGVLVTDFDGKILLYNHSFQDIFGLKAGTVGRSLSELRIAKLLEACQQVLHKGSGVVETIELTFPIRKYLDAHIEVLGAKTKPSGLVIVFHDITQIKHLEQIRRDFVANVSHELRTPLTAIKGYTETLLGNEGLDPNKSRDFLNTVLRHSDRMSQLVEDLLILAKLESFEDEELPAEMDIKQIVADVVKGVSSVLERKELEIKVEIPEYLPSALGLANEIETVLQNLIDNAIKYGAKGKEILVSAFELETEIKVSVSDKGVGIPVDDQPRIFERFYRVDKGRARELGGTGLGLSIVKHVVQRHQGRIWVESEVGKGSTFNFTIPRVSKDTVSAV